MAMGEKSIWEDEKYWSMGWSFRISDTGEVLIYADYVARGMKALSAFLADNADT